MAIPFEQPNSGWNNRARVDACRGLLPRAVEVGRDFGSGKQSRMFPSRYDRDQFIQVLNVGHFRVKFIAFQILWPNVLRGADGK